MTSEHLRLIEKYKPVEKPKKKQKDVIGKVYNNLKIVSLHKDSKIMMCKQFIVKCLDCDCDYIKTFQNISISKVGCSCGAKTTSNKPSTIWQNALTHDGVTRTLKQWASNLQLTTPQKAKVKYRYEVKEYRTYELLFILKDSRMIDRAERRELAIKKIMEKEIEAIKKIKARTLKALEKWGN